MSLRPALASTTRVRHVYLRASTCAITTRTMSSLHPQEHPPAVDLERTSLPSARSRMLTSTGPSPTSGPESSREGPGELSDQEWEIRTGRAIYVLQQTLPTFFSTGLISSLDTSASNTKGKEDDEITIYSPSIRLEYRPPAPFPPAFPKTLHVEGLPLYLASSAFVRHTLNALYTDLRVELQRVRVHGPRSSSTSGLRPDSDPNKPKESQQSNKTRSIREKSLFIGLRVVGVNRVSKAEGGWEVNSTYTFSPVTGLICLHNIDSIQPAPHQAFFSALQAALNKIGLGGPSGAEGIGGVARNSPPPQTQSTHPVARS